MKKEKRHISLEKKLIIGIVIALIILTSLLYLYHNYWKGVYIVNNVPTSFVGVGIIIIISLTICAVFIQGGILLGVHFPPQPEIEKQNKNIDD